MMKITPELLEKYDAGKCTVEEKIAVEQWLNSTEKEDTRYSPSLIQKLKESIWGSLSENIGDGRTTTTRLHIRMMRYAAAAIILFTVGFLAYNYARKESQSPVSGLVNFENLKTIETRRGEKRTVTLSDGSTIRMNYETEIRVPERFEGGERVAYLTGHAHFDVARDTERPFIIYTKDSKTQVLGTSFDINTKVEGDTEIIVTSGKVTFAEKGHLDNQVTLIVNDRAVLNSDKNIETTEVDALELTAWKDNRLVLDDKTLKEIIEVLEPWYDVRISVENKKLLTESFNLNLNNPSLKGVLDRLGFMGDFDYQIDGKKVVIL